MINVVMINFCLIFLDYLKVLKINMIFEYLFLIIAIILVILLKTRETEICKKYTNLFITIIFFLITGIKFPILIWIYYEISKKNSIRLILKSHLIINLMLFLTIIFLGYFNIYQNLAIKSYLYNNTIIVRNTLGFYSPNTWGVYFFHIVASITFLVKKYRIIIILLLMKITYLLYRETFSRTSFIIIIFYLMMFTIFNRFKYFSMKSRKYIIIIPLFFVLISIYLGINYGPYFYKLNKILTGRLYLSYLAIKIYGISFISRKKIEIPVDNSYILYLVAKGWGILIIIITIYTLKLKKILKNTKNCKYIPYIICIFIYAFSENILVGYQGINILNILCAIGYSKKNRRKNEENYK